MRRLTFGIASLLLLTGCAAIHDRVMARRFPSGNADSMVIDGLTRTFQVHRPAPAVAHPSLVLVLHGGGATAAATEAGSGFDQAADRHGFVAVYPQGIDRSWADGRGKDPADQQHVDDVAFLRALIDREIRVDGVDPAHVFATGISNGGFMAYRLACEAATQVAAVAPTAASLGTTTASSCHPAQPVSILDIHGTADPLVPLAGGTMHGRGRATEILSADDVHRLWSRLDACTSSHHSRWPDRVADGTHITTATATGCAAGTTVEQMTIIGGGHTWPGGAQYLPARLIGKVSHQIYAPEFILRFFINHPRRDSGMPSQ